MCTPPRKLAFAAATVASVQLVDFRNVRRLMLGRARVPFRLVLVICVFVLCLGVDRIPSGAFLTAKQKSRIVENACASSLKRRCLSSGPPLGRPASASDGYRHVPQNQGSCQLARPTFNSIISNGWRKY